MTSDQVVRTPLHGREASRRNLEQRLSVRFPVLAAISARALAALPPTSRLRRAALGRAAELAFAAYNRRDLDAVVVGWHPEFDYYPARAVEAGLVEPRYRGRDGYRRYVATTSEAWGGENRLEPIEIVDARDRFAVLGRVHMRGQSSGVPLTEEYATVMTLGDGVVRRVDEYFDHSEAVEALGSTMGGDGRPAAGGGVRKPLRVRHATQRTLDQRIFLRFPGLATPAFRRFERLPVGSRLRQALLWRTVRLAIEAYNRRDLHAASIGFHPDAEYHPYREFVEAGLAEPVYRGPAGYRAYIESTYEVWGADVRLEPTELIDLGDRFVLLADMPMRAQASGVPLGETYACVTTLKEGRLIRQQDYLNQAEALEAAGLDSPRRSAARA